MSEELKYSLRKLRDAFLRLKEGSLQATDELEKDGVIQRFEFTFELLWKTLKLFLREKGIEARTPKDCLQEAFRISWLKDEEVFAQMMEDRNKTSHIYSQEKSKEIFGHIKKNYIGSIAVVIAELEKVLKDIY